MNTVLKRLSVGWIARYRVFSIANDPVAVFGVDCVLDRSKIWTQIRQSLWKDGQGTVADACRLQFPVAISPSLRRFSVLGDIYTPRPPTDGQQSYHTSSVVPDFNNILKEAWDMSTRTNTYGANSDSRTVTLDSWIHRNCMLYLYWIWLSTDGRYAFFLDKAASKPSNLAVYDLGHPDAASKPHLISYGTVELYRGTKEMHCDAVSFHPSQALIVFTIVGCVYLWPYKNGNPALILRCPRPKLTTTDISTIEQIYHGFDRFESVTFTDCGRFVIINPVAAMYPVTKEIPFSIRKLLDTPTAVDNVHPSSTELGELMSMSEESIFPQVLDVDIATSDVVYGSHVTVRNDGSTSGISTNCSAHDEIQIYLWSDNAKSRTRSEAKLGVFRLPNWIDAKTVSTALLPQLREERIRMVVEQMKEPWSSLSNKRSGRPLLVERNRRSMKHYTRQVSGGKRVAPWAPYSLTTEGRASLKGDSAPETFD
jgi:hypothetical protein